MRPDTGATAATARASATTRFRTDLEGLRALAVVLVLLDHVIGWPKGGFIGVDVFFVLSGFLITGLLLKEFERTGGISFRAFYARRVKRIFPMSMLVIAATAATSYLVFLGPRLNQIMMDAVYATFFSANWRFILVGQDYFAADRAVSPLQHYWSLAVEEQFYFVWPLLMLGALSLGGRRRSEMGRRRVFIVLSMVTAASLAWAMVETLQSPSTAYFSTFTRAWELGLGGLLAVAASRFRTRDPRVHLWASHLGLGIIIAAGLMLTPDWDFPGPWALLPVAGTLLIVASGIGAPSDGLNSLLTNRPARYLGRISFSLYLWHWPVVVFLQPFIREGSLPYVLTALALSLVLASLSYHLVEDPIRRSAWLTPAARRRIGNAARRRRFKIQTTVLAILFPLTGGAAYASVLHAWPDVTPATSAATLDRPAEEHEQAEEAPQSIEQQISIALERTDWPQFAVPLENLEDSKAPEWTQDGCIDVSDADLERCTYEGPASKTAVVLGDSVAISWMAGIREALSDADYEVVLITMGQCPAVAASVSDLGGAADFAGRCQTFQDWSNEKVDDYSPDLVVLSSAENSLGRLTSSATERGAVLEWRTATERTLKRLVAPERDVVVLAPPPEGVNLQGCVTRFNGPSSCTSTIGENWTLQSEAELGAAQATEGARYVSTRDWFCRSDGLCPAFVDDIPVRADGNHLTARYSEFLAPELREVLLQP
ncbi:O-antigen acetylase [Serinicoccus hydrothermalis]|uniref:O-antigen acetylase n=1 Tax=Serinicoccus hydrothermalis TaxID=1758689 RepID=A0A1B1NE91_9MICO|nr:acyltransferase family protein [Serinicoccus hydrothermalis]ANS79769.1 O-antigen acetylase [Serinicoccus hydrothermalis]